MKSNEVPIEQSALLVRRQSLPEQRRDDTHRHIGEDEDNALDDIRAVVENERDEDEKSIGSTHP